jgi:hypothetical protein
LIALFVVGIIIYAMSKPTATSAPVAPVPQIVAPIAAPVTPKHVVKKHRRKHAAHRIPATAVVTPAAEPSKANVDAEANAQSHEN